jgi:hypothetical protein
MGVSHMARGGHGLPKVLLGPAMPYPSTLCGFAVEKSGRKLIPQVRHKKVRKKLIAEVRHKKVEKNSYMK